MKKYETSHCFQGFQQTVTALQDSIFFMPWSLGLERVTELVF